MEYIAPQLQCIMDLQAQMKAGDSVKLSLHRYIDRHEGPFSEGLKLWLLKNGSFKDGLENPFSKSGFYTKSLIGLISKGLEGEPILKNLNELEQELRQACKGQVDQYMERLSLLSLVPLLVFQFPAFMLLLFGPVFKDLMEKLTQ